MNLSYFHLEMFITIPSENIECIVKENALYSWCVREIIRRAVVLCIIIRPY